MHNICQLLIYKKKCTLIITLLAIDFFLKKKKFYSTINYSNCIVYKINNKNYLINNLSNKYINILYNKIFNSKMHIASIINFNKTINTNIACVFNKTINILLFFFYLKYLHSIKLKIVNNYLLF